MEAEAEADPGGRPPIPGIMQAHCSGAPAADGGATSADSTSTSSSTMSSSSSFSSFSGLPPPSRSSSTSTLGSGRVPEALESEEEASEPKLKCERTRGGFSGVVSSEMGY